MARERSEMRRVKEVLRLRLAFGLSHNAIGAACRMPPQKGADRTGLRAGCLSRPGGLVRGLHISAQTACDFSLIRPLFRGNSPSDFGDFATPVSLPSATAVG